MDFILETKFSIFTIILETKFSIFIFVPSPLHVGTEKYRVSLWLQRNVPFVPFVPRFLGGDLITSFFRVEAKKRSPCKTFSSKTPKNPPYPSKLWNIGTNLSLYNYYIIYNIYLLLKINHLQTLVLRFRTKFVKISQSAFLEQMEQMEQEYPPKDRFWYQIFYLHPPAPRKKDTPKPVVISKVVL